MDAMRYAGIPENWLGVDLLEGRRPTLYGFCEQQVVGQKTGFVFLLRCRGESLHHGFLLYSCCTNVKTS